MNLSDESRMALVAAIRPIEALRTIIMPKVTDHHRAKIRMALQSEISATDKLRFVAHLLKLDPVLVDRVFAVRLKGQLQAKATVNRIYNLLDLAKGSTS